LGPNTSSLLLVVAHVGVRSGVSLANPFARYPQKVGGGSIPNPQPCIATAVA